MLRKGELMVAVLTTFCLTGTLFSVVPSRSDVGTYDIWADIDNDGKIDMWDVGKVARLFGTSGTNVTRASIEYDSGWVDIADKQGKNIVIAHNLNSNDVMIYITGRTTVEDGAHQRHLGATGNTLGWNKTYGGTWADEAYALVQTSDSGYALAGRTLSFGAGGYDFWLVKTDAMGNMQWNKTYGGTGTDYARALVGTVDGGYALAGYTDSFGAGGYDFWLVKTDAMGNMQWNKTYGGASLDYAQALVGADDGGYALAGYTDSFGAGGYDFWLVKTDAMGNMQWNKTYGGASLDYAQALVGTVDGGYALAGRTAASFSDFTTRDFWLVKTDAFGSVEWNKTYGGEVLDWAFALVGTDDGGYALAGSTFSFGAGSNDFWLVKTDIETGFSYGLSWIGSSANSVTLYRGSKDSYWNYVRARVWAPA